MELDECDLFEEKKIKLRAFQWSSRFFDMLPIFFSDYDCSLCMVGSMLFLRQKYAPAYPVVEGDFIVKFSDHYQVIPGDWIKAHET